MTEIEYKVVQPDASLFHFVESYWMVVNNSNQPKEIVVLPDGRVDIHFFYADTESFHIAIAGLECYPSHTAIPPNSVMFAVSFKLLAIEYVLNMPIADIVNDRSFLPDNFWGISKDDLGDFDVFCQKVSEKITELIKANVDDAVKEKKEERLDTRKLKMFDLIYSKKGSVSVKEISEAVHWSSRQINRYFTQWFGLSLKAYTNILRFRASFPNIKAGKLFPESDFSDQAHFIKEIKKYSGYTPKELHKNKDDRFVQLSTLKQQSLQQKQLTQK